MTRRIVQRRAARQDILDIVAYIAVDNPDAAQALYDADDGRRPLCD
jgi:plasmid stabilization system protein ParE